MHVWEISCGGFEADLRPHTHGFGDAIGGLARPFTETILLEDGVAGRPK